MTTTKAIGVKAGDKIWFEREKRPYTIRANNDRYLICTKPFFETVLYTIVDLVEGIRGPNDFVFNIYDYKKSDGCKECLEDLVSGKALISHRKRVPLDIIKVLKPKEKSYE